MSKLKIKLNTWQKALFLALFLIISALLIFPKSLRALPMAASLKVNVIPPRIAYDSSCTNCFKYSPNEVLVTFKKDRVNLQNPGLASWFNEFNTKFSNHLTQENVLKTSNIVVYKIKDGNKVEDVINELKSNPNVEDASFNYYYKPADLGTNDTYKASIWGMDNTAQTIQTGPFTYATGSADADIDMPEAWNVTKGSTDVIVAVIDTGVDYTNPDLANVMWDGTNCVDNNGNTISGGCTHGYEFYATSGGDVDPSPDVGTENTHGTHVAGIIGAQYNNSKGITGVGPRIKIMAIKFGFDSASQVEAIDFATRNGAKVINASYGGTYEDSAVYDAIQRFQTAGGIFVAAAGNSAINNDTTPHYPCNFDLNNIICVAATDNKDKLATFSNYGATSVDVAAPGVDIISTVDYKYVYREIFDNLTPDGGSTWGLVTYSSGEKGIVGDLDGVNNGSYTNNISSYMTSGAIDLSGSSGVSTVFHLGTYCEDSGTIDGDGYAAGDYMSLEVSPDGSTYNEILRWNYAALEAAFGTNQEELDLNLASNYLNSNFHYRFHWVTDSSSNTGFGCSMYRISIDSFPKDGTSGYDFLQGTSMASPYVAGLVGYLWSASPSATYSEISNIVITTGDSLSDLSGKTVSGKRINAYSAVQALGSLPTPTTYTEIDTALSGMGVDSNIGEIPDASAASGLYFAKSNYGKIEFTNTLDLTDSTVLTWLQNLGDFLNLSTRDVISLDTSSVSAILDTQANLTFYNVYFNSPAVLVDGAADTGSVISNFSYNTSAHTITFTVSHFTSFSIYDTAPGTTPTSGSADTPKGEFTAPGVPGCSDAAPLTGPDVFYIKTNKGKVTMYFTPTIGQTTGYAVIYGTSKGDERYGFISYPINNNEGIQNAVLGSLDPNTTYYFKIAGLNGCASTGWSDWLPAKPSGDKNIYKYKVIIENGIRTLIKIL